MAGAAVMERAGSEEEGCADETEAAARLQQKEQDLQLAAQLGQALLLKNEELSSENARRAAEYASHLEALEQERHSLRLQMSALEVEHQAQVLQLQADISAVREQIDRQQHCGKDTDKQRSQMLDDLTEQNQRLSRQLREAAKGEKQLQMQIEQLRGQQQLRTDTFQFQTASVDAMRAEITSLSEQRQDLERRLRGLLEQRTELIGQLQESSERQLALERERRERSGEVRCGRRKVEELAAANSSLTERLEAAAGLSPPRSGVLSPGGGGHNSSLRHELDSSVDEGIGSGTTGSHLASVDVIMADLGDGAEVESDEPPLTPQSAAELALLRQEAHQTAAQMSALAQLAREQLPATGSDAEAGAQATEPEPPEQGAPGQLLRALAALQSPLEALLSARPPPSAGTCTVCARPQPAPLETKLAGVRRQLEQLQQQHQLQTGTLQQLNEELQRQGRQIAMREKQYTALEEEKSILKAELDDAYVAKEDLVRKAWEARDQAVQRKNAAELELSRVRIDVLQANSQLLESVQCKVRLSCQLEQWQWDMQQLVDAEIQQKLDRSQRSRTSPVTPTSRGNAILRFFSRS